MNKIQDLASNFKVKLRDFRLERKLSQKMFAEILSILHSTYANWEQGRREPSIYEIYKILILFDAEPNALFGWDDVVL